MTFAVLAGIAGIVLLWMVSGATPAPTSPRTPEERVALESQYKAALARGAKIDAIKYYRALHGTDLKHSKDAVERVLAGLA